MPFVITHWINLTAMIFLIITGFIIHFPVAGVMGIARGLHVFFGFVIFINCVARVLMSFFIKSAPTGGTRQQVADFKTWLPQKDNRHQGGAWVKYYLFMKKDHPLGAKLGVPQKISYLLIPILILIMFIHIYLANVEGTEPTKLMFFRKEHGGLVYDPDKHVIVGEDTLEEVEE